MQRKLDIANKDKVIKLLKRIKTGINSIIEDYYYLFTIQELFFLKEVFYMFCKEIKNIEKFDELNITQIAILFEYEELLKFYSFKCFENETLNGYEYISWIKDEEINPNLRIISATFSKNLTSIFCNSTIGIKYDVSYDGYLGSLAKDAATIVGNLPKSIYTLFKFDDGTTVNSYNLATPISTPKLLDNNLANDYNSKHNEIILNNSFIKPLEVIYLNDENYLKACQISDFYNIPVISPLDVKVLKNSKKQ